MTAQLPILTVAPLLFGAFAVTAGRFLYRRANYAVAALALALSFAASVLLAVQVFAHGTTTYFVGGWPPPIGISYVADPLSALMLAVVSGAALCVFLASKAEIETSYPLKNSAFFALFLLAAAGHMGIVATGDAFNLYVLIEVAALSGYAILAQGKDRAMLSSLNYLFVGSFGASLYLLGIGYLYLMTGSLNMADLSAIIGRLGGVGSSTALGAAFGIILAGLWVKMGLFPFHSWLPAAYTFSAAPAAALVAPLTTKVMAYVLVRLIISLFTPREAWSVPAVNTLAVGLATAAILYGSFCALAQRSLRRMLCFILLSEVGYMVGGAFLGNRAGLTGTIYHIFADLLMTLCLFLAASNVERATGGRFSDMGGLFRRMPATSAALVAGGLSMIGVPPFCGFFSKWYLLSGAISAGSYLFAVALVVSSLVNAFLFFRIFEIGFFRPAPGQDGGGQAGHAAPPPLGRDEMPLARLVPLGVAASSLVAAGLLAGEIVTRVAGAVIPPGLG
ncbi:MAG: complex I subunit 5 family protein [Thermodesulfobacteriota bacterium]